MAVSCPRICRRCLSSDQLVICALCMIRALLANDILFCNVTNVQNLTSRRLAIEGQLYGSEAVRGDVVRHPLFYRSARSLWNTEAQSFCKILELPPSSSSTASSSSSPPSQRDVPRSAVFAVDRRWLTILKLDKKCSSLSSDFGCFSVDKWIEKFHSLTRLSLLVLHYDGDERCINHSKLLTSLRGKLRFL
ncbi:unnamed protein product [Soboliphyme baturini]|uniref:Uncharacterized protein n=1 Tax=Soboliphyme baturini TaxID=241478 RepID=A0A183J8Y2_9BILA|nr:unnamed protein product [Soboliphyme baturini]